LGILGQSCGSLSSMSSSQLSPSVIAMPVLFMLTCRADTCTR
jgi:hypothetical protein